MIDKWPNCRRHRHGGTSLHINITKAGSLLLLLLLFMCVISGLPLSGLSTTTNCSFRELRGEEEIPLVGGESRDRGINVLHSTFNEFVVFQGHSPCLFSDSKQVGGTSGLGVPA